MNCCQNFLNFCMKKTKALLRLLQEEAEEKIYAEIKAWEDSDCRTAFLAIFDNNKKELRKLVLSIIRYDRKSYNLGRTMVDPIAYAFLRQEMDMEPIRAAEVLDGDLDISLPDKNRWKLPYQEEIEEWLKL